MATQASTGPPKGVLLAFAYGAIWVGLAGFALFLHLRVRALRSEVSWLARRLMEEPGKDDCA